MTIDGTRSSVRREYDGASPAAIIQGAVSMLVAPVWNGIRGRDYTVPPVMTPGAKIALIDREHLQDCSQLSLSEFSLGNRLMKMTGGKSHVAWRIRDMLGVADIDANARALAEIAKVDRDFVTAAMEGRLLTAALRIPLDGLIDYDRCELVEILGELAHVHMVANTLRACRIVFGRLHCPTGFTRLDDNRGALVTVGSAAKALKRETVDITRVIKLERKARDTRLTCREEAFVQSLGIIDEARGIETHLKMIYGEAFLPWYEEMIDLVEHDTKLGHRIASRLAKSGPTQFMPLHLIHGPSALPTFYLSLLEAIAWTRRDPETSKSPLEDAVTAIANFGTLIMPSTHKNMATEAQELFFLLRTFYVRDANSFSRWAAKRNPNADIDAMCKAEHRRQLALPKTKERFRIKPIVTAARALNKWVCANLANSEAQAILAEVRGSILVQLRV